MAANGILIGLGLLAGVALGPPSLLVLAPFLLVVQVLQEWVRGASLALLWACVLIGALGALLVTDPTLRTNLDGIRAAVGVVELMPVAGGMYERTIIRISKQQHDDDSWSAASGTVLAYFPEHGGGVSKGDEVFLVWEALPLSHLSPGYARFVRTLGASGSATVWTYSIQREGPAWLHVLSDLRRHISGTVAGSIQGDAGALAAGIVTGDDSGLSQPTENAF